MAQRRIKTSHIVQAFIAAPLVPIAIGAIFVLFLPAQERLGLLAILLIIHYLPSLIFGIPYVWFLNSKEKLTGRTIIGAGMLLGAFTAVAVFQAFLYAKNGQFEALEGWSLLPLLVYWPAMGIMYSLLISIPFCIIAGVPIFPPRAISDDK